MKKAKAVTSSESLRKMRPALSEEARESQMISLAVDLAENSCKKELLLLRSLPTISSLVQLRRELKRKFS